MTREKSIALRPTSSKPRIPEHQLANRISFSVASSRPTAVTNMTPSAMHRQVKRPSSATAHVSAPRIHQQPVRPPVASSNITAISSSTVAVPAKSTPRMNGQAVLPVRVPVRPLAHTHVSTVAPPIVHAPTPQSCEAVPVLSCSANDLNQFDPGADASCQHVPESRPHATALSTSLTVMNEYERFAAEFSSENFVPNNTCANCSRQEVRMNDTFACPADSTPGLDCNTPVFPDTVAATVESAVTELAGEPFAADANAVCNEPRQILDAHTSSTSDMHSSVMQPIASSMAASFSLPADLMATRHDLSSTLHDIADFADEAVPASIVAETYVPAVASSSELAPESGADDLSISQPGSAIEQAPIPANNACLVVAPSPVVLRTVRPISARIFAPTASSIARTHRPVPVQQDDAPTIPVRLPPADFVPPISRPRPLPGLASTPFNYRDTIPSLDHIFAFICNGPPGAHISSRITDACLMLLNSTPSALAPAAAKTPLPLPLRFHIQHRQKLEVFEVVRAGFAQLVEWQPVPYLQAPEPQSRASETDEDATTRAMTSADWPATGNSSGRYASPIDASYQWSLLWSWGQPSVTHDLLLLMQRINHFPGSRELTRKDTLHMHLRRVRSLGFKQKQALDIAPETFMLPLEESQFITAFANRSALVGDERNAWITKPVADSRGNGIAVTNQFDCILPATRPTIVQQYITEPFLLAGHKFDLRLYVLVTSFAPTLEAFLYSDGFARLSTVRYSNDPSSFGNRFVHLTNAAVQRENADALLSRDAQSSASANLFPDDAEVAGGSKISLTHWRTLMSNAGVDVDALWLKIHSVVIKTLVCAQDSIPAHPCAFELFGFDIIIDSDCRPWLLEVNSSPSFECDSPLDWRTKTSLVADTVRLVRPLAFDLERLRSLISRRAQPGERWFPKAPRNADELQLWTNQELEALLRGEVPRRVGEMPRELGAYVRIAPSPLATKIEGLLRSSAKK